MKIFLKIARWIIIYLFFLEIFFQLGGFIYVEKRDIENTTKSRKNDTYKIMCLGDSMTMGEEAYPIQLETILNTKQKKIKFVVINEAHSGSGLHYILDHLDEYLNKYKPDMVIMMSGLVNDNFIQISNNNSLLPYLNKLKTYTLLKSLISKASKKFQSFSASRNKIQNEPQNDSAKNNGQLDAYLKERENYVELNPSSENYTILAYLSRSFYKKDLALQYALKAISLNSQNYLALNLIANYYLEINDYAKATPFFFQYL